MTALEQVGPGSCSGWSGSSGDGEARRGTVLRRGLCAWLAAAALAAMVTVPGAARAGEGYDPQRAGNPLRIVYYAVYPVAFTLDWLIFRPAYYIGQCQPFRTVFGVELADENIEEETAPADDGD